MKLEIEFKPISEPIPKDVGVMVIEDGMIYDRTLELTTDSDGFTGFIWETREFGETVDWYEYENSEEFEITHWVPASEVRDAIRTKAYESIELVEVKG